MGVGLAATQLGVLRRMLVFQAGADATPTAVANPAIEWLSDELAVAEEGCLSLPGIGVDVERAAARPGARRRRRAASRCCSRRPGLEARVLQHEIDHLDGVLILDRTEREQRKGALRALREGEQLHPPSARGRAAEAEARRRRAEPACDRLPRHLGVRGDGAAPARRGRSTGRCWW